LLLEHDKVFAYVSKKLKILLKFFFFQMLAELEEVIEYKLVPERRPVIKEMWWHRLKGIFSDKNIFQKI
jgi:hypothetical protein